MEASELGEEGRPSTGPADLRWTDHHCHLDPGFVRDGDEPTPGGVAGVVVDGRRAGVLRLIDVGTDVETSARALEVARRHEGVWCTAGVHPHEARTVHGADGVDGLAPLEHLLVEPEVVAVGECGLDYHYDHSPRDQQRAVFAAQIELAHRHHLPIVVHTREAWDDTFDILAAEGVPAGSVLHCFTGGPDEARRVLDLGLYLSFSGIVTFKTAGELRDAARLCPLDRLLVETDSPFLAPVPHRGRPNRPALLPLVGAAIAEVKDRPVGEVAGATWANAAHAYHLPS